MSRSFVSTMAVVSLAVMLGTGLAANAHGKECDGVTYPEQTMVEGGTLSLNGLGLHKATMLKVKAYVAALYVAKTSSNANAILESNSPYVLILQLLRDVSAGDVSKGWDEGFERNAKGQLPALKDRIAMLNGWMADMKAGQKLTFSFKPGAGVQVNVNGAVKGTIKGDDFGKAFLSISLGADAADSELKAGLLGGACE